MITRLRACAALSAWRASLSGPPVEVPVRTPSSSSSSSSSWPRRRQDRGAVVAASPLPLTATKTATGQRRQGAGGAKEPHGCDLLLFLEEWHCGARRPTRVRDAGG